MAIPPPGRMIDIGSRRLHVDVMGSGPARVLLESGLAATSVSWALVAKRVAEFATIITYDRAGLGWSDPAPDGATALDAARDLAAMLDRIELSGPLLFVGHSFGGLIGRIFQQRYPERVSGLILLDPVCRSEWRVPDEARRKTLAHGVLLSRRGELLARLGVVRLALFLVLKGARGMPKLLARASAGRGAELTERLTGEVGKMPPECWPVVASHWSRSRSFRTMANALENLPVSVAQLDENRSLGDLPVVVLSSSNTNAEGQREHEHDARLSTRGEHRIVPNTQHWLQLDAPEVVIEAIRGLLR
jgi:pimeloyl-ACP methyl ester carboxylesterase